METLEEYEVYDKLIEVELKLNEETKITVNNLKNNELVEVEKPKTELEVEQIKSEKKIEREVIKLPKTEM